MRTELPMSHTPTTAEEVSAYLVSTRWASDEVVRLSGGYANHVFRIHLRQPLDDGGDTVIVKHAKRFAVGELDFTVERQVSAFCMKPFRNMV